MSPCALRLSPTSLDDRRKTLSRDSDIRVNDTIDSLFPPPSHQCTRAQTTTYLLGACKEMPDVDNKVINHMHTVQNFYKGPGMDDQPIELTAERYNHDKTNLELEKTTFEPSAGKESLPPLLPYMKELKNVKSKLLCSEHGGDDTFCWVDATQPTTLSTVHTRLARVGQHDTQNPDNVCVALPKTLHFNEIQKMRKEQSTLSLQRVSTKLISPIIHNHIHLTPAANDIVISEVVFSRQQGDGATMPPWPLKRTYALYVESDKESDGDELPQSINDILVSVHSRYPAFNFPEYIRKMKDHGIFYLPTAAHFNIVFYEENVGMPAGAAYTFQVCFTSSHEGGMCEEEKQGQREEEGMVPVWQQG
ncbi:hypothetical protein EV702DRAFT_1204718 [Suillus placidus]|uniref:Uncharacterized protein n=1 Tax=Suillus placidus TaxID=48579 RepID=A0A9P6ZGI7_9AGAM|nr:hypothetical protein EV702DRAFT_1204718 [Suillus placidus]